MKAASREGQTAPTTATPNKEDVMELDRFRRKMQEGRALTYVILWMLGVPASILFLFFILGSGR